MSNWEKRPLDEFQLRYAAMDAVALVRILESLTTTRQKLGLNVDSVSQVPRRVVGWSDEGQACSPWWTDELRVLTREGCTPKKLHNGKKKFKPAAKCTYLQQKDARMVCSFRGSTRGLTGLGQQGEKG